MGLAGFIRKNKDRILKEWDDFARTRGPAADDMTLAALRDHAEQILMTIADNMERPQSKEQQADKAKGESDSWTGINEVARQHGVGRAESGFTLKQTVSEYRALRASVLRLWGELAEDPDSLSTDELTRFNEAVDEGLTESVANYSREIDRARDLLVGIVGHDLRNPLGAIIRSAGEIVETEDPSNPHYRTASRILDSGRRMKAILADLTDLTRTRLGGQIAIARIKGDLERVARQVIEESGSAYPRHDVRLETTGQLRGSWDAGRIAQALSNLIANAARHGAPEGDITVTLRGEEDEVVLGVHNVGPAIPEDQRSRMFQPLQRFGREGSAPRPTGEGLGLGLFIVKEIALAHGGRVEVESSKEAGTTFWVHLPREEKKR